TGSRRRPRHRPLPRTPHRRLPPLLGRLQRPDRRQRLLPGLQRLRRPRQRLRRQRRRKPDLLPNDRRTAPRPRLGSRRRLLPHPGTRRTRCPHRARRNRQTTSIKRLPRPGTRGAHPLAPSETATIPATRQPQTPGDTPGRAGDDRLRVSIFRNANWVSIGDRYVLPDFFYVWVDDPAIPAFRLSFSVSDDGLVRCNSAHVDRRKGEPSLTSAQLRAIPIDRIQREAEALAVGEVFQDEAGEWISRHSGLGDLVDVGAFRKAFDLAALSRRPRQGRRLSDEHFQEVARIYREANARSEPPTAALTKAPLYASPPTAGRWVMEARRRGFLGPAPAQRKKGEAQRPAQPQPPKEDNGD